MSTAVDERDVVHKDPIARLQNPQNGEIDLAEEAKDEEDQSSEGGYSNESLYDEIIDADPSDFIHPEGDGDDFCTKEESLALRKRLREVGGENFIQETLSSGKYSAIKLLSAFRVMRPEYLTDPESILELLGFAMYRELSLRGRLNEYRTMEDAVELLLTRKNILVITGAGISTSLGIPDFRSRNTGFYSKLRNMGFEDPESVFTLEEFDDDPARFYALAGDLIPELNKWSPTHQFIRILQDQHKLLRNYTQNIDNVESYAGIKSDKIVHCHGSWKTASCRKCKYQIPGEELFPYLRQKEVARCKKCDLSSSNGLKRKRSDQATSNGKARKRGDYDDDDDDDDGQYDIPEAGVMKPDITFFGESLPDDFYNSLNNIDRHAVDLVIVIGTSMMVAPVSEIPQHISHDVPCIYISRDPCKHIEFDIELLGDCDVVTQELCRRAGWDMSHPMVRKDVEVLVQKHEENEWAWLVKAKGKEESVTEGDAAASAAA